MADQMIGAPGHSKDVVDALNATTKKYIKQKMWMVSNPVSHECCDQKMKVHSVSEMTSFSMGCLCLCTLEERNDGVPNANNQHMCQSTSTTCRKDGTFDWDS
jgi:hypothetical protein